MHCVQGESCDASMAGSVLLSHCQDRNCKLNDYYLIIIIDIILITDIDYCY
jgi:hypothetical protein